MRNYIKYLKQSKRHLWKQGDDIARFYLIGLKPGHICPNPGLIETCYRQLPDKLIKIPAGLSEKILNQKEK